MSGSNSLISALFSLTLTILVQRAQQQQKLANRLKLAKTLAMATQNDMLIKWLQEAGTTFSIYLVNWDVKYV